MFRTSNVNKTVQFFVVPLKYREITTAKTVTLHKKLYFFIKCLKNKKKKLPITSFIMAAEKNDWAIRKSLFP